MRKVCVLCVRMRLCAMWPHVSMCVFESAPPQNAHKIFSSVKGSEWEMRGANETSQEYEPRRDTETL